MAESPEVKVFKIPSLDVLAEKSLAKRHAKDRIVKFSKLVKVSPYFWRGDISDENIQHAIDILGKCGFYDNVDKKNINERYMSESFEGNRFATAATLAVANFVGRSYEGEDSWPSAKVKRNDRKRIAKLCPGLNEHLPNEPVVST